MKLKVLKSGMEENKMGFNDLFNVEESVCESNDLLVLGSENEVHSLSASAAFFD